MISLNNKLILKPYEGDKKLKAEVKGGFAKVSQKTNLVGLEVLTNASIILNGGQVTIEAGSIAYFREEVLYAHEWSKKKHRADFIDEEFIIADYSNVVAVK